MFEEYTYERLMQDALDNAPEGIDTRQGSIFYDAVSGITIKIAKLYTDLDLVARLVAIDTATGEALDTRASEYGMYRHSATCAKYKVTFEGVQPLAGERFYYDGHYFVLGQDEDGTYYLEAEVAGESENGIYSGTEAVPINNIEGLAAATFGDIYEHGTDAEDDENFRARLREKISGPAENGNKQHYKTWCESIDGVGQARIYPLWNGPNTVKAVLIDGTGQPCGAPKVAEVQEYVDPATKGYTATVDGRVYVVGDGLGEGVANLGAHFTAAAAIAVTIDVEFTAEIRSSSTKDTAQEEAIEAIEVYFRELVLENEDAADVVVRYTTVGAIIAGLDSVLDYSGLTLNGGTENIRPGEDGVPVLGEVVVK